MRCSGSEFCQRQKRLIRAVRELLHDSFVRLPSASQGPLKRSDRKNVSGMNSNTEARVLHIQGRPAHVPEKKSLCAAIALGEKMSKSEKRKKKSKKKSAQ